MIKAFLVFSCALAGYCLVNLSSSMAGLEWKVNLGDVKLAPSYSVELKEPFWRSKVEENLADDFLLRQILILRDEHNTPSYCLGTLKLQTVFLRSQDTQFVRNLSNLISLLSYISSGGIVTASLNYFVALFRLYEKSRKLATVVDVLVLSLLFFVIVIVVLALLNPATSTLYACVVASTPQTNVGEVFLQLELLGARWELVMLLLGGSLFTLLALTSIARQVWTWRKSFAKENQKVLD